MEKLWEKHFTKKQLYGHLSSISQTIQLRCINDAGQCRRNKDQFISDVFYVHELVSTPTSQIFLTSEWKSNLPEVIAYRYGWFGKAKEMCAFNTSWYIYIYICCRVARMDFPDSLLLFASITPRFWHMFWTKSCVRIELSEMNSSWSSNSWMSVWRGPLKMSLMKSLLLLQKSPACGNCLMWMVLKIEGRWPYNCFL